MAAAALAGLWVISEQEHPLQTQTNKYSKQALDVPGDTVLCMGRNRELLQH